MAAIAGGEFPSVAEVKCGGEQSASQKAKRKWQRAKRQLRGRNPKALRAFSSSVASRSLMGICAEDCWF
jgi:hypothetical protein